MFELVLSNCRYVLRQDLIDNENKALAQLPLPPL